MKSIGLLGGLSWESTALYYRLINREIGARRGGLHSANLRLHSFDFEQVVQRQRAGAWGLLAAMLAHAARGLERAGAQCLLIGSNTMHRVADEVQAAVSIPLLHIVDTTACAIRAARTRRVALLGTRYTMEQRFYVERLALAGIECVVPEEAERAEVHRIIFDELCRGVIDPLSRRWLQALLRRLAQRGAEGAVLGCTELSLILADEDAELPLFDSTRHHALAAVDFALAAHGASAHDRSRRTALGLLERSAGPCDRSDRRRSMQSAAA